MCVCENVCIYVCVCVCVNYFCLFALDSVLQDVGPMNSCHVLVIPFIQMRMYAHQISPFFMWKEAKQPHWKLSNNYNSLLSISLQPYFLNAVESAMIIM